MPAVLNTSVAEQQPDWTFHSFRASIDSIAEFYVLEKHQSTDIETQKLPMSLLGGSRSCLDP